MKLTPRGEFLVGLAVIAMLIFLVSLGAAINGPS